MIVFQDNKIIDIADVISDPKMILNILIEFIEVNISEKLTGKIADRQALVMGRVKKRFVAGNFVKEA